MADVGCRCLGSQRFAGQDGDMADAVFKTVCVHVCVCTCVCVYMCVYMCVCVCKLAHTYQSSTIRPMCYTTRHQVGVCQRNWSACGLMYSKIQSRLTLVCAWS